MNRKKDGWVIIILGVLAVIACIFVYFIHRYNMRGEFDRLMEKEYVLKIDFGIVPVQKKLKETNALLRKVDQDENLYLYLCKDGTLFIYHTEWFYAVDPMGGNVVEYKEKLSTEKMDSILTRIRDKKIDSLYAKVVDDYIEIILDDNPAYIQRNELQYILQDNKIDVRAFN